MSTAPAPSDPSLRPTLEAACARSASIRPWPRRCSPTSPCSRAGTRPTTSPPCATRARWSASTCSTRWRCTPTSMASRAAARWPTSAPAPACPASRWRSSSPACRSRWSRATARRRASCAKRCASSAWRDVRVAESRIEAVDEPGAFDAITARALATLPLILELGGHLLKPDGALLAMKGAHPADEIAALPAGWASATAPAARARARRRTAPGRGRAA